MPTRPRLVLPGTHYHVTQRGNYQQPIFFADADRLHYLDWFTHAAAHHGLDLLAWALMNNHVHLIVYAHAADSLALTIRRAHSRFAQYINGRRQRRRGHLFQRRFFSCPLSESHLWHALAYTELNPVRAHLVAQAEHYPWSSAAVHCGGAPWPWYLKAEPWNRQFDPGDDRWRERLALGLDAEILWRLRDATLRGHPFGEAHFLQEAEQRLGYGLPRRRLAGRPKLALTPFKGTQAH